MERSKWHFTNNNQDLSQIVVHNALSQCHNVTMHCIRAVPNEGGIGKSISDAEISRDPCDISRVEGNLEIRGVDFPIPPSFGWCTDTMTFWNMIYGGFGILVLNKVQVKKKIIVSENHFWATLHCNDTTTLEIQLQEWFHLLCWWIHLHHPQIWGAWPTWR